MDNGPGDALWTTFHRFPRDLLTGTRHVDAVRSRRQEILAKDCSRRKKGHPLREEEGRLCPPSALFCVGRESLLRVAQKSLLLERAPARGPVEGGAFVWRRFSGACLPGTGHELRARVGQERSLHSACPVFARREPDHGAFARSQDVLTQMLFTSASGDHSDVPTPLPQPAQPRFIEITNLPQAPFSPTIFVVRNSWQGPIGLEWIFAYAGAKANVDGTPGQGGIVLYTQVATASGNFDFSPIGTFLAPGGTRMLTIVTVNGNLMKLHAENGQEFTFNLQTHQYH